MVWDRVPHAHWMKCEADQALFYIHTSKDILILAIHVDDCTMTRSSNDFIQSYKLKIKSKYDLTDFRQSIGCLALKSLGIVKTAPYHFPNHPISTHSLGDLILQILDLTQHLWTWIFNIWRICARRHQNKLHKCTTYLTMKLLAHSFTLLLPHVQILCSWLEYSCNLWIIWDEFIGRGWSTYFGIWLVWGIGFWFMGWRWRV